MIPEKIMLKIYAGVLGAASAWAAHKLVEGAWKFVTGDDEPPQPDDPEVPALKAVSWAVASGVGIAGSQLLVNRLANKRWLKHTDINPVSGNKPSN